MLCFLLSFLTSTIALADVVKHGGSYQGGGGGGGGNFVCARLACVCLGMTASGL